MNLLSTLSHAESLILRETADTIMQLATADAEKPINLKSLDTMLEGLDPRVHLALMLQMMACYTTASTVYQKAVMAEKADPVLIGSAGCLVGALGEVVGRIFQRDPDIADTAGASRRVLFGLSEIRRSALQKLATPRIITLDRGN